MTEKAIHDILRSVRWGWKMLRGDVRKLNCRDMMRCFVRKGDNVVC